MKIKESYPVKLLLYIYKRFFEEQPLVLFLLVALLLNIVSWFLVSIKGRPENFLIPLHYLSIKGVTKTGPWYYIYIIPFAGLVALAINFSTAFILEKKDLRGSYILASATIFLEIFFIIASLLLVFRV